jgi:4-aminobutyrate aminotransferase-like enzyme
MESAPAETDLARYARTMNPYWVDVLTWLQLERPWREARDCLLIDDSGREYLDVTSGFGTATLGHRAPAIEQALIDHLQAPGGSISSFGWSSEASKVADTLLRLADGDFDKVQFFSAGAEAIEAALKFAAIATGRSCFLSLSGGFHGLTGRGILAGGYRDAAGIRRNPAVARSRYRPRATRTGRCCGCSAGAAPGQRWLARALIRAPGCAQRCLSRHGYAVDRR